MHFCSSVYKSNSANLYNDAAEWARRTFCDATYVAYYRNNFEHLITGNVLLQVLVNISNVQFFKENNSCQEINFTSEPTCPANNYFIDNPSFPSLPARLPQNHRLIVA